MRKLPRSVRLAGEDLREHRHVCALIDGPDDAYDLLLPFIVEGLELGERAIHLVDPGTRDAHIERLRERGIDVEAVTASRQLDVQTWTDSYLRGGRFDGAAQLDYIRETLDEGRELGFPRTRLIGSTEWALERDTARALLNYETHIDDLLLRRPDALVCTYDLNRHSARMIADVIGTHPVSLVGGILRTSRGPARASARDRLLAAAARLFHDNGIQATGVDAIIEAAGVAKATFYRHFPSKDDLVIAWLRDPRARWFDRVRAQSQAAGADPGEEILLFFDAVAGWLEAEGYRGCPYLNTAVEITAPDHPALPIVRTYLDEVESYLRTLAAGAGYVRAGLIGKQLLALLAGAISLAVARHNGDSALAARDAAQHLLAQAERRPRS